MPCWPWFVQDPLLEKMRALPAAQEYLAGLERRYHFFRREFPMDDPATLGFVATEVES